MSAVSNLAMWFSQNARKRRAEVFRRWFSIDRGTKVLDIGSEDGSNMFSVLDGTDHDPSNVFIADINHDSVARGAERYGFVPVVIDETGSLPFESRAFDIVYCSSVIEHVTLPHNEVWEHRDGKIFRQIAHEHQRSFADEIRRVGKRYFVQTPAAGFPIESHTWLPLAGYLPRRALLPTMKVANRVWPKASIPDFNLLNEKELVQLFPDARILKETSMGLTKSLMAIKVNV